MIKRQPSRSLQEQPNIQHLEKVEKRKDKIPKIQRLVHSKYAWLKSMGEELTFGYLID
jgi:hypothetical protein